LTTVNPIDPLLLPSKPRILVSIYDKINSNFYIKWLVDSNGGSELEELNVTFVEYNNIGIVQTLSKSKLK
jgi:hypothetical protein